MTFQYRRRTLDDLRGHLSRRTAAERWQEIEGEYGPLDLLFDEALKHCISVQKRIAEITGEPLQLPPVVQLWELDRMRRISAARKGSRRSARSVEERRKIRAAKQRLLQELPPRRPKHRPRKRLAARMLQAEAVAELRERRLALQQDERRLYHVALGQAAAEIAPNYGVKPATLISWAEHPGRFHRPRRRPK